MTSSVVSRVTINATPGEVFKYLADTTYHILWNPHLQSINPKKLLREGDIYRTTSLLLGIKVSGKNRVTKLSGSEMQVENSTGTLKYTVHYRLQARKRPTLLTCTTKVMTDSRYFAFTGPILNRLVRRELQSDLKALKIAVEHGLS